jgi:hypothetical protein
MTRIKNITKKLMLPVLAVILTLNASAQDSAKTFVLSGSADGYYRYNFMAPAGGATNNKTSFTNSQNSFELGMATVRADATADGGKIAATADLGFGRRAEEFSYADGTGGLGSSSRNSANNFVTLAAVKQLYFSYTPGKYMTYTIGKWATHIGYEVLDAYANRNYSMDYMFSFGPFSHTGFKAQYTKGNVGIMLGVANPTDNATTLGSGVKTLIAQFSDSIGKVKAYLNYQGFFGANSGTFAPGTPTAVTYNNLKSLNQVDLVLTTTLNSKWGLGFNGTAQFRTDTSAAVGSKTWWGAALYLNFDPNTKLGWTFRGEYVGDSKFSLMPDKSLYDFTLTADIHLGTQFTLMPEIRFDGAQDPIFLKSDGTSTTSTFTGLVAVAYKF